MLYRKDRLRQGFTLAELLIVVAIIAVLTAVAIPVFSGVLERSRESTDLANIRAAYAEAAMAVLDGGSGERRVPLVQEVAGWEEANRDVKIGQHCIIDQIPDVQPGGVVVVTVSPEGILTLTTEAP